MRFTMVCSVCESSIGGCQRRGCMVRVLSARFSLELTTLFPFRQSVALLLDRCPRRDFQEKPKLSILLISLSEDPYDSSCVLAPTLVCPRVLSNAALFPSLAPP